MLAEFATHCGIAFTTHKTIMATLFMGGLMGGVTHCVGMCGPFVISQAAARLEAMPVAQMTEWSRLRGAALLPYHLGRLTTYTLLGVAAAALAAPLRQQDWFGAVAFGLLVLAGCLFLAQALRLVLPRLLPAFRLPAALQYLLQRLFAAPVGWRGYLLGVMLGFLPCGLVYAALMVVAARGDVWAALLGMLAFGLGTMPLLVLVGVGGQYVAGRWRRVLSYLSPIIMGANALVLFMVAGGYLK